MQVTKLGRAAIAATALFVTAAAQAFPDKPINYIIPFTPGGESDYVARQQAEVFRQKYNQTMIVQNKPGAGGALVWSQLNGMPADGYTIAGVNLPHIVLQPLEPSGSAYKTDDIAPVYFYHYTPDAIVVHADSPYQTLQDLLKAAKEKPGTLTFAGSGSLSANHMAHERLNRMAGVKTTYVPFKGTSDMLSSILGRHVDAAMSYSTFAIQQKGRMRMLAIASDKRHPAFPDVPTFRELGFDWVDGAYRGIAMPKSTSPEIQKKVSDIMHAINNEPALREKLTAAGYDVIDVPIEKMPAFMAERKKAYLEDAKNAGLVK